MKYSPRDPKIIEWEKRHDENVLWCKLWTRLSIIAMALTIGLIAYLIFVPNDRWWVTIIIMAAAFGFWILRLECLSRDIELHEERNDML